MRPIGAIPRWAQALSVYVAPMLPWNGSANKVKPTDSQIQSGYTPAQRLPAPHFNWLINWITTFLDSLDGIDLQNWSAPVTVGAIGIVAAQPLITKERNGRFWTALDAFSGGLMYSSNGYTWDLTGSSVPTIGPILSFPEAANSGHTIAASQSGPGTLWYKTFGGNPHSWASVDVSAPGVDTLFYSGARDATNRIAYFGGQIDGTTPIVWSVTDTMGSPQVEGIFSPAVNLCKIEYLAISPTSSIRIAMGIKSAGVVQVWISTTLVQGGDWFESGPLSILGVSGNVTGLFWDPDRLVFILTVESAVWQSANGTTWSLVATADANRLFQPLTLCVRGGIYLASCQDALGMLYITYSLDGGATWTKVGNPCADSTTLLYTNAVDDRFLVISDSAQVSSNLRLRP